MSETCLTCRFVDVRDSDEPGLRCRRYPRMRHIKEPLDYWCGEHQPREVEPRRFEGRPCALVDEAPGVVRCLTCDGTQKEGALFKQFACELEKTKEREPGWYWVQYNGEKWMPRYYYGDGEGWHMWRGKAPDIESRINVGPRLEPLA